MKPNIKITLFVIIYLLGISGAFLGGAYWNSIVNFKLNRQDFLSTVYVQATSSQLALEKIDSNEIAKGHYIIMAGLAVNIVTLDDMINDEEDKVMQARIESLLQRIAKNRDKFPKYYNISDDQRPETQESISIINKILQKYKKGESNTPPKFEH